MTRYREPFSWKHHSRSHNSEAVSDMNDTTPSRLSILRRRQVQVRTGLSRSTIYAFIKAGEFPKQVRLGPRAVGWLECEVNDWIAAHMRMVCDNRKK